MCVKTYLPDLCSPCLHGTFRLVVFVMKLNRARILHGPVTFAILLTVKPENFHFRNRGSQNISCIKHVFLSLRLVLLDELPSTLLPNGLVGICLFSARLHGDFVQETCEIIYHSCVRPSQLNGQRKLDEAFEISQSQCQN